MAKSDLDRTEIFSLVVNTVNTTIDEETDTEWVVQPDLPKWVGEGEGGINKTKVESVQLEKTLECINF